MKTSMITMTNSRSRRKDRTLAAITAVVGVLTLTLAACATTPPPTAQMAVSAAAVAHAVGAGGVELAPLEMSMANSKMSRARLAMDAKDYESALALAQQAQLDAQLAESKAEAIKARKSADALGEASRALREEMTRKGQ